MPRAGLLVCGYATLVLLAGCAGGPTEETYRSAQDAVDEQDWSLAAELWYDIHLSEGGESERSFMETSRALYESGDAESACSMLRFGRLAHPKSGEIPAMHGLILETKGFTRAAESAYGDWAKIEPDNPEAPLALGRVRLSLGWEHAAGIALMRAAELAPENPQVQVQLAKLRRATGEDELAFEHFLAAWDLGFRDPSFYLDGSMTAMELGAERASPEQALEWATLAAELQPQNTRAHFLRGFHLQALGRRDDAIAAYYRAVETDPACLEGLSRLATLYAEAGESERLVDLVVRALELETDSANRDRLRGLVSTKEK